MDIEAPITPLPQSEMAPGNPGFHDGLQKLADRLPEVAEHQEAIRQRGDELISEFGISPELFADMSHTLLFCAIADRYATLENTRTDMSPADYASKKEFVGNAVMLLALEKSAYYDELKDAIGPVLSNKILEGAYGRFANHQVTKELEVAIRENGFLDKVKGRLGITPVNEDPFNLRVLNIATPSALDGMEPEAPDQTDGADVDESEAEESVEADFSRYEEGLWNNSEEFAKQLSPQGDDRGLAWLEQAVAWVTHDDEDIRTLVMPLPMAEKLLYTEEPRRSWYKDSRLPQDQAVLEHEYTHTQGGYRVGTYYGVAAEEARAEHFSGNQLGYNDVRLFYNDVSLVTGFDIVDQLDAHPKGGTSEELYTTLVEKVGLQNALDIALAAPSVYLASGGRIYRQAAMHVGSFSALTKRLYEEALQDPKRAAEMDAKIDDAARRLISTPDDIPLYPYNRPYGGAMTELVGTRAKQLRTQASGDK